MKKIVFISIIFCLIFIRIYAVDISAKSAIVMDCGSGRVLYEKNAYSKMGMASTTKIVTAIVAIEQADLEDIVTVSPNASGVEGSSIWLAAGEKIKLEDLLYGIMLNSGNDAAVAIAEFVAGDVPAFCELMNQKAKSIGANNTHFTNPNGLSDPDHYTTAYDLALITRYALSNPVFSEIVKTERKAIPWEDRGYNRKLANHNKMLRFYDGCDGVKTGFTKDTGRTLVTSATRGGLRVVAVTLNAPDDWNDHTKMLDSAFASYKSKQIARAGETYGAIKVKGGIENQVQAVTGQDFCAALTDSENYAVTVEMQEEIDAPVKRGQTLGTAAVKINGVSCFSYSLVAGSDVAAKKTIGDRGREYMANLTKIFICWFRR